MGGGVVQAMYGHNTELSGLQILFFFNLGEFYA